MRSRLLLIAAALATTAAIVACGSSATSAFDASGTNAPGKNDGTGGASGDADATPSQLGNDAGGGAAAGAGSVVLVHAARNLPAFRVCFQDHTNTLPLPDDKIMPNANVVGVDVGTAVHVGQLEPKQSSNPDASIAAYDSGVEGGVDSGPLPTGELHVIEEKLARQFFPQNTDANAWPNCGDLVNVLRQNGYEGHGLYTLKGDTLTPDLNSAIFVVVKGCLPDPALTTTECGPGFTTTAGNLSYQTLQVVAQDGSGFDFEGVSASPAVADMSTLVYSPDGQSKSDPISLKATSVSSSASSTLPADYTVAKFTLAAPNGAALITSSLADIQARSAPRVLPADFFGLRSTFVLFAIGDPKVTDQTAPNALHLIAVPVQDPAKIDPDSGAL